MSDITIAHYGEERERIATESELAIFEIIKEMSGRDDVQLVRKSDNYVSAIIGDWDLARFKYTPRAKWIMFPCVDLGSVKRKIEEPDDVRDFSEEMQRSLATIAKFSND